MQTPHRPSVAHRRALPPALGCGKGICEWVRPPSLRSIHLMSSVCLQLAAGPVRGKGAASLANHTPREHGRTAMRRAWTGRASSRPFSRKVTALWDPKRCGSLSHRIGPLSIVERSACFSIDAYDTPPEFASTAAICRDTGSERGISYEIIFRDDEILAPSDGLARRFRKTGKWAVAAGPIPTIVLQASWDRCSPGQRMSPEVLCGSKRKTL